MEEKQVKLTYPSTLSDVSKLIKIHKEPYKELQSIFNNVRKEFLKKGLVFQHHHRLKSTSSLLEKTVNGKELNDIIGFRILNPWTIHLVKISTELEKVFEKEYKMVLKKKVYTENNKVIHMYFQYKWKYIFEVQFWPSLMYYGFEYEHDRVYKEKNGPLTAIEILDSTTLRRKEHQLQNLIDANPLFMWDQKGDVPVKT